MQFVYVNLCAFIVRMGKKFCEYYRGANHLKNLVQLSANLPKNPKNPTKIPKLPKIPTKIPKIPKISAKIPKIPKISAKIPKIPKIPRNPKNLNKNLKNLENPTEITNLWKSRTTFLR